MIRRRRSKYGNKKTIIDGITFASKKEAARYLVLKEQEEAGLISQLRLQVSHSLKVNKKLICRYIADFVYVDANGQEIVEDVKGRITPVYALKKKLMDACLGIQILET